MTGTPSFDISFYYLFRLILLAVKDFLQVHVERGSHRRSLRIGSLKVKPQTVFLYSLGRSLSETSYPYVSLVEIWKIFQQRLDSGRAEEYEHVIVKRFILAKIIAHGAIHHSFGIRYLVFIKDAQIVTMNIRNRKQELFFAVLQKIFQQLLVIKFSRCAEKYFIVSGIVILISSHKRKKWSIAVLAVNITAV